MSKAKKEETQEDEATIWARIFYDRYFKLPPKGREGHIEFLACKFREFEAEGRRAVQHELRELIGAKAEDDE